MPDTEDAVIADYSQLIDFRFINHGDAVTISVWRDESKIYCSIEDADAPGMIASAVTEIDADAE